MAFLLALAAQAAAALAGTYDGHQMELAAGLELRADGRFDYGLAYGALDETGQGRWVVADGRVLLTSDPVTPPRILLAARGPAPAGTLRVTLATPPGISPQYFDAVVTTAHGATAGGQLSDDGLALGVDPADPPVSIRLVLPMVELQGDVVPLDPAGGYALAFRFEPHDLGKVDFRGTALRIDHGDLLLERHGRTIRFRRTR